MARKEDVHFLIDNASPAEVEYVLACLEPDVAYSTEELRKRLLSEWGYSAQRNLTFSTRRLLDLGLAGKANTASGKSGHVIAQLGERVRGILSIDQELYAEIMHFLHYTSYDGSPSSRKLFWSYRTCCEIVWARKQVPSTPELVAEVQSRIAELFPSAYASRVGGNFNAGGVSSGWKPWLAQLQPSPFASEGRALIPRHSHRFELAALALDHVYRSRGYRYGDPVILDEPLLDEVARVFLLDPVCCRELIDLAARLTKAIKLSDTFTGTSVTLLAPYGIERL
jgi:hypothetical protein